MYSETVSILAASPPSQPSAPETTYDVSNVLVSWSEPSELNGSAITSYTIHLKEIDGVEYRTELEHCDGALPSIRDSRSCSIPKTILSDEPYDFENTEEVCATITATNEAGDSLVSSENCGALMATVPSAPRELIKEPSNPT